MKMLQFGRSMIEMLGVLAIIAVLSIGGLLGYRRAVNNHQANVILDDVNRFAFVILERSGLALGEVIPKGDFVESGIYTLEGYQDVEPEQFSITVFDVPRGVCESLLPKAAAEYAVRVKEHGEGDGPLYDSKHQDLCQDTNDIVLYFGSTDDLFCGQLSKCTKYSSDCKCLECEEGYQLSKNNSSDPDGQYCVLNACKGTGGECASNDDCCKSTDFCSFGKATDCIETSTDIGTPNVATGKCAPVSGYGDGTDSQTINGVKWIRSTNLYDMTYIWSHWWCAKNWCERHKRMDGTNMILASIQDLGCNVTPGNYCDTSKTVFASLQAGGWSDSNYYWLSNYDDSCYAYRIRLDTGYVGVRRIEGAHYALCH